MFTLPFDDSYLIFPAPIAIRQSQSIEIGETKIQRSIKESSI